MIRIVLAHRGGLVRGALAAVLAAEPDFEVIAESGRTDDTLAEAGRMRPDIVVLDDQLPGSISAAELTARLLSDGDVGHGVLLVGGFGGGPPVSTDLLRRSPRVGLITAESRPADLLDGIRRMARGQMVLDPGSLLAIMGDSPGGGLTPREMDVLRIAASGAPVQEIATRLFISAGTVRNYLSRIMQKVGARNRVDAVRMARESGWL
jgi:two-component system response regulator DesR